jgi:ribosomal protein S27E
VSIASALLAVQMTPEVAKQLREPFPANKVGKLPRITCPDCSKSSTKICAKHSKARCDVCGAWITAKHIHLDFVGHADVTDRFLEVDSAWTWEPMGFDSDGLPALDAKGGLWIWLVLAGVRRPGYGDSSAGAGVKEAIGDALRNAGMRFGVGLDLWRKEPLVVDDEDDGNRASQPRSSSGTPLASEKQTKFIKSLGDDLYKLIGADTTDAFYAGILERLVKDSSAMTVPEAKTVIDALLQRKEDATQAGIPS